MHLKTLLIGSLALACAMPALAAMTARVANILPEVKKRLAVARQYASDRSWDFATANADAVLISDNVAIHADFDYVPAAQRDLCKKALNAALAQWQKSLDDSIHFRMEEDAAKADIKVTFRPDVRMGREAVAGLTNWTRAIHTSGGHVTDVSYKGDMQVRERDLQFHPMSFEVMRQETEHEFGHVLGLDDSDRIGDLMGELDPAHPVSCPLDYEVQAVKDLRAEAKRIKADADSARQREDKG